MALYEGSRYVSAGLYMREGTPTIRTRVIDRDIPSNSRYYTIVQGDSLDFLAFRFYGDPRYWWVLADANPQLNDHLTDLPKGVQIVVPPLQTTLRGRAGR